jgi:hypothetical protein
MNEEGDREVEGWRKASLYDLLKPMALGKVKLSKLTQRRLEKEMRRVEKNLNRRRLPANRKQGWASKRRMRERLKHRRKLRNNPVRGLTPERKYRKARLNALSRGVEFTITYPEFEAMYRPYWEAGEQAVLVRRDLGVGYTSTNTLILPKSKYYKLIALRGALVFKQLRNRSNGVTTRRSKDT